MKRRVSISDAAAARQVTAISISDDVLASFKQAPTVWEGLYQWLIANHNAGPGSDLHNRTRAGRQLMKRLRKAEAARLKRKHKIDGEELQRAVTWSNLNSGPMETVDGISLDGDALFVIPFEEEKR